MDPHRKASPLRDVTQSNSVPTFGRSSQRQGRIKLQSPFRQKGPHRLAPFRSLAGSISSKPRRRCNGQSRQNINLNGIYDIRNSLNAGKLTRIQNRTEIAATFLSDGMPGFYTPDVLSSPFARNNEPGTDSQQARRVLRTIVS
jgi:hypothetical protein